MNLHCLRKLAADTDSPRLDRCDMVVKVENIVQSFPLDHGDRLFLLLIRRWILHLGYFDLVDHHQFSTKLLLHRIYLGERCVGRKLHLIFGYG